MSPRLIRALANPMAYSHPVGTIDTLETHISWVLLAGDYAYKIKKPVKLPFVDFGSLEARHHYCLEELRLNRRFAPQLYLDVVPITGSPESPHLGGAGAVLEYAVQMRRFGQDALFDHLLAKGALGPEVINRLAERIAAFHAAAPAATGAAFGTPRGVLQPALDNFAELAAHPDAPRRSVLDSLQAWTRRTFARLEPVFAARRRGGRIRECHGDLHLRNIALIGGEPVPFDCIEFSEELRWIDVLNEAAFLVMDLMDRGRPDLGYRFLDHYLARTGDYGGIAVLRFYLAYRALVRAKVHDLRARQADADPREAVRLQAAVDHYLALAGDIARGGPPALILMHGFSGAGKSRVAAALVEALPAIRVRSDVERKRLFGLDAADRSHSDVGAGIYDPEAGAKTYAHLADCARMILTAGHSAILDAAFLANRQRAPMFALAKGLSVPIRIVDCRADADTLRGRVGARATRGRDPSEATVAVLEHQLRAHEPLTAIEETHVVRCPMEGTESACIAACVDRVKRSLNGHAQSTPATPLEPRNKVR